MHEYGFRIEPKKSIIEFTLPLSHGKLSRFFWETLYMAMLPLKVEFILILNKIEFDHRQNNNTHETLEAKRF